MYPVLSKSRNVVVKLRKSVLVVCPAEGTLSCDTKDSSKVFSQMGILPFTPTYHSGCRLRSSVMNTSSLYPAPPVRSILSRFWDLAIWKPYLLNFKRSFFTARSGLYSKARFSHLSGSIFSCFGGAASGISIVSSWGLILSV